MMISNYRVCLFVLFALLLLTACQSGYDEVQAAKTAGQSHSDVVQAEHDQQQGLENERQKQANLTDFTSNISGAECFSPQYHERLAELEGKTYSLNSLDRAQIDEVLDKISSGLVTLRANYSVWEGFTDDQQIVFFFEEDLDEAMRGIHTMESYDLSGLFPADAKLSYFHDLLIHQDEHMIYVFAYASEGRQIARVFQFDPACSLEPLQVLERNYTGQEDETVVFADEERVYLVKLYSMELIRDYALNGWQVVESYSDYNVEERSHEYYIYLFHRKENKFKKVLLNTSETIYEVDNPLGDGEIQHIAHGLYGNLYIGGQIDQAPAIYRAYEDGTLKYIEPNVVHIDDRIQEIWNLYFLHVGDEIEFAMIVSDNPDTVITTTRLDYDITDHVARMVCLQEDVYDLDIWEIDQRIETRYMEMGQFAPSPHEVADIFRKVGSCFREQSEASLDGNAKLRAQVNALREAALALNDEVYTYNDYVNGGGSMYVAFANRYPGVLEIDLYHYVQEALDRHDLTDDTDEFTQLVTTITDRLEEMKSSVKHDEHALAIVANLEASMTTIVELLNERTAAEQRLLQKLSLWIVESLP